jgi:anhydro-N-acetylmuramic acid kinase
MSDQTVLGFMSGTSTDGIDAAILVTDGERIIDWGPHGFTPYGRLERDILREAMVIAPAIVSRQDRPGIVAQAERLVTQAHLNAARQIIDDNPGLAIDLIGFHGQTIFHAPERRLTVQIGDASVLARQVGLPVVHDMRAADVAAGGEGAPLAPVYHRALARHAGLSGDIAVINIGGVSNFTRIGADGSLIAADTGPGNALLDDFIHARTGEAMDFGGETAAAGQINEAIVSQWLAAPWFSRPAPKSLDRNAFSLEPVAGLGLHDGAATLTGFTSGAIVKGIVNAGGATRAIVVGGGSHNPTLLRKLSQDIGFEVETGESVGWNSDFIEAEAFAYMAVRSCLGLPLTYPATTGVGTPLTGGRLVEP